VSSNSPKSDFLSSPEPPFQTLDLEDDDLVRFFEWLDLNRPMMASALSRRFPHIAPWEIQEVIDNACDKLFFGKGCRVRDSSPYGLILKICHNRLIDEIRKREKADFRYERKNRDFFRSLPCKHECIESEIETEEVQIVRKVLESLSSEDSCILQAWLERGLGLNGSNGHWSKYAKAGIESELTCSAIRMRLQRILKKLKREVSSYGSPESSTNTN